MMFMDFVKCSKYKSIKSHCSEKNGEKNESSMNGDNESNDFHNKNCMFLEERNNLQNTNSVNVKSYSVKNKCYDNYSKLHLSWTNKTNSVQQFFELPYDMKIQVSDQDTQDKIFSSLEEDKDFQCPRCNQNMQEPRLLPCLHPICSSCVSELMNISFPKFSKDITIQNFQLKTNENNYYETCPLCDFQLPNVNSAIPPPHYLLQHRLIMNTFHSKFANKILCDICKDEIVAMVQCSTCLHNFCLDCGIEHQQQITMELKPLKHSLRPLWEATKIRRTVLCQEHPTHALHFYCIACQQVSCKECIWSNQHRGHASENAIEAAKQVIWYLRKMLQKAKILLNMLLTQYDRDAFLNTSEEIKNIFISMNYRYIKYNNFFLIIY